MKRDGAVVCIGGVKEEEGEQWVKGTGRRRKRWRIRIWRSRCKRGRKKRKRMSWRNRRRRRTLVASQPEKHWCQDFNKMLNEVMLKR